MIVAIDGPAASGKSTAAKKLAELLGYVYLDTGAMYRAITYIALKNNIVDDIDKVIKAVKGLDISLKFENSVTRVFVNDEEVTDFIRTPEVSEKVSEISRIPEVRTELVRLQKQMSEKGSIVAEGRDITTVVFPNADVKIYMNASADVRTERRYKEFIEKGMDVKIDDVRENLKKRDEIDSGREISPLRKTEEAIEVDTTNLTVEEELTKIVALIKKAELNSHHNSLK
ncbi:MAG: cytidylate kinase [Ignavibacteriae bacterium HGW-Ignavibacteriae-2]|nr:(d)CMP kinase [Bacteroidota bacterium]PKL88394.1 MAG: cytidylate kinase [Ignavibacteriae bacterium HGW-Ignavibacteriae-2]